MRVLAATSMCLVSVVVSGCRGSSDTSVSPVPAAGAVEGVVVYGVGVSTDPYGQSSSGRGFGVVTGLPSGRLSEVESGKGWDGHTVSWVAPDVIQVGRPEKPGEVLFSYKDGRLALD